MIKRIIASQKGASSILVVLLLVVLVVFGVAALTTSLSSLRLSQKVTEWNAQYYEAEAVAWERFAQIDRAVSSLSGADEARAAEALDALDFETEIETVPAGLIVRYEAWCKDGAIGIDAALAFDAPNKSGESLHVVQWREIQQEGSE